MTKPAAIDGTQLYKISDYVTWGWNYTNLLATPTAIDVLVSCSSASATWTLTQNMTFETTASYVWDTKQFQLDNVQNPLLVAEYPCRLRRGRRNQSATPTPGYLAPFTGFRFGLYTPQPYKPIGDWICSTCSGAMSDMERRGLGFAMIMCTLTVLSFTWFIAGFSGMMI